MKSKKVINLLEKKSKILGVPIIPRKKREEKFTPYDPNPTVAICGECGLELKKVMCYSCQHPDCPCFTRVTC